LNQVFAGAYILYCRYYNPYLDKESDIIDTLFTIKKQRDIEAVNTPAFLPAASRLAGKFREQAVSISRKILARIK
jgi:hypothetical protein